jgi:hypothetical protein
MCMPRALIYGLEELLHGIDRTLCFALNLWQSISRLPASRIFQGLTLLSSVFRHHPVTPYSRARFWVK